MCHREKISFSNSDKSLILLNHEYVFAYVLDIKWVFPIKYSSKRLSKMLCFHLSVYLSTRLSICLPIYYLFLSFCSLRMEQVLSTAELLYPHPLHSLNLIWASLTCPGWPWVWSPPASASWVAENVDLHHQACLHLVIYKTTVTNKLLVYLKLHLIPRCHLVQAK